ncbi:kinase-like protein [Basidiobolus meristosporus CBS 931.73]|uniref:non-specific serine/threonine protein kinase n=1 Tax=Basidiobolus meristosporus CBS 931.73 TaxID=1314790 RepID=A0A1Y1Y5L2_9FUNG|nr:kinase-like protein [Basidiobolus meristosporus CBS 931.73]|eukprot:ORX93302.1 kinase-like protein [Basidiobolus meristosporus CBS 931.73]
MALSKAASELKSLVYLGLSSCIPLPVLNINGRSFKIIKLLGEGGFSMVYLVRDSTTGRQFALKKIQCPLGTDSFKDAMREAELYKLFSHPNIIRVLDNCVTQDRSGDKIVYIFLPYYKNGTLQDVLSANVMNHLQLPEKKILKLFHGICLAVRELHTFELPNIPVTSEQPTEIATENENNRVAYAHRDIKPSNIMISDDGSPILMDFGSVIRARTVIKTRQQALLEQDRAAEFSTMAYRAPELFDVKTGSVLNEKVDIWSLGCLLYAMTYGQSPFEANQNDQGGSIALAVQNCKYTFPSDDLYSEHLRELIRYILVLDVKQRPDIHQVISRLDEMLFN